MRKPQILMPQGGWKSNTWYLVRVKCFESNPEHFALFYSGFLNGADGGPGGYSGVVAINSAHSDEPYPDLKDLYYFNPIKPLVDQRGVILADKEKP